MRVFVIAAMGSVLVAGCAPFEHGHYTEDVAYVNTKGDPPGTPLVYQEDKSQRAQYNPTAYAAIQSNTTWPQATPTFANNTFGAGGFPTSSVSQPIQYSRPVSFSASAPSLNVQQVSLPAPAISSPNFSAYSAPIQQVYSAPPVQTFAPQIQQVVSQPVQQVYSAPVRQIYSPPVQTGLTRASYVAPTVQQTLPRKSANHVLATSYGGHRIDADGYAVCDISWPGHASHQIPQVQASTPLLAAPNLRSASFQAPRF